MEEAAPGESGPPAKELIPTAYNVDSKEYVEVSAEGKNEFEIKIP